MLRPTRAARCGPTSARAVQEAVERRRWSQELAGSPFEKLFARGGLEVALAPADDGHRGRARRATRSRVGLGALRRRDAAPRGAAPARRRARRPGRLRRARREARAACSGAGASRAPGRRCPTTRRGFLRDGLGVEGAVVSRPVALEDVRLRAAGAAGRGCARGSRRSWGRSTCATTRPRASAAAAASPTSTCCASARATARTRRTPWWRRATQRRPSR